MAPTEGKSVYARLYMSVLQGESNLAVTKMNWKLMKASFEDLSSRYTAPYFRNAFASYSCMARDKAAFAGAMKILPKEDLIKDDWLSDYGYEACMQWSAV